MCEHMIFIAIKKPKSFRYFLIVLLRQLFIVGHRIVCGANSYVTR